MRYLPHTPEDIAEMLDATGARSLEDFFAVIPPECRRTRPMVLPEPMTEWELNAHIDELAGRMARQPRVLGLPGRRELRPFHPVGRRFPHVALRVRHLLHPLSARDEPGHAAGDLRVPDARLRACSAWRWPTPPCTTAPPPWPRRCSWRSASPGARRSRSRVPCTRSTGGWCGPTWSRPGSRCVELPFRADGRTDLEALGPEDRWRQSPCSRRTSSGASRTSRFGGAGARGRGAVRRHLYRAACLRAPQEPGQPGGRHRLRRRPEPRDSPLLRRAGAGDVRRQADARAQHARPPGGRNAGPGRAARVRAHPRHPRAAHPPGKGHLQHLHQQQPLRPHGGHLHGLPGRDRPARARAAQPRQAAST